MTREEAIFTLNENVKNACWPMYQDAIDMAIEALKAKTQGDLISRAEAIEALGEEPPVWCDEEGEIAERNQWRADIEAIKSVPSADTVEVVRCKDCKHYKPFDKSKKFDCPQGLYAVFEKDYCSHGERTL